MGQSGKQTTDLQNRLREFGYKVDPDGQFGPKTRAAVIAFQKTHKDASGKPLKVDGLVGPKTTSALRKNTKQEYIRKVAGSRRMTAATAKGPKASGKE
jgi:peptidoglycan hydrolase-like protein with peptidoglycan-binding domain